MKHLALALSALVLGSGCVVTTDECSRSISTDWSFLDADGFVLNCGTAGVQWVDLFLDGAYVDSFACTSGQTGFPVTITGVGSGTHTLIAEGLDAGSVIRYRHQIQVDSSSCGDQLVHAQPGEGRLNLMYSATTSGWLWYSLYDNIAGSYVTYQGYGYPTPNDVVVALPEGSFSLSWMSVVNGSGTALSRACTLPPSFNVLAADTYVTSNISLLSYATYPTCP